MDIETEDLTSYIAGYDDYVEDSQKEETDDLEEIDIEWEKCVDKELGVL